MKNRWIVVIGAISAALASAPARAASDRYVYFISDSHFGIGHTSSGGTWDNYEDARWPDDLAAFLTYVDQTAGGRADLVMNGDTFELWQSREVPCKYAGEKGTGCSASDARRRLQRVVSQHAREMKMLGEFTRKGSNRLFLVVGNHDVALLLPGMEDLVRAALQLGPERFALLRSGLWESDDHLILAEHGHEIPTDPNAFPGWPDKVVFQRKQEAHVPRPWGEQFVQEFYNQFESRYPAIDNFTSDGDGIGYALRAEGVVGSAVGVASFLKFLAFRQSWKQFGQVLGTDSDNPQWDIAAERKKGSQFLVDSFPKNEGVRVAVTPNNRHDVDEFVRNPEMLSDGEIREICDARRERAKSGAPILTCQTTSGLGTDEGTLGSVADNLLRRRDARINTHLAALNKKPRIFIYSHTHAADRFTLSDSKIAVFNTGAWQRLLTKAEFEKMVGASDPIPFFRKLTPDDLAACYTFVLVAPYKDTPRGALKTWRRAAASKQWEASDKTCH
jgi:UDP-2,3-diacylglucosamine pyrophosphatase LpxH